MRNYNIINQNIILRVEELFMRENVVFMMRSVHCSSLTYGYGGQPWTNPVYNFLDEVYQF